MLDFEKLAILVNGAKFDVSCSSSGSHRKSRNGCLGDTAYGGICHSFTEDGRCISLLKILQSNRCVYSCEYCVNRRGNDVPRASATPDEICELTVDFYRRNMIEGLFLSSAIEQNPDYTMEKLTETAMRLRKLYRFNGYIHLKGIPSADPSLIRKAGRYVDRMSFNVELPSERSLKLLAPQKTKTGIFTPMSLAAEEYRDSTQLRNGHCLPAGQTTQMIVGASPEPDGAILRLSQALYRKFSLKRVYYSSYIPTNPQSKLLPSAPAGLLKEHRLYQADWLIRFYGFTAEELLSEDENLSEGFDPKCGWALKHPEFFPVEVNTAPPELLLRVPGIGFHGATKIVKARRYGKLSFEDLARMRVVLKRAEHFITCNGRFFGLENRSALKNALLLADNGASPAQLSLFSDPAVALTAATGEL